MNTDKAILTCAVTGVLTNPQQYPVPVTPAQMAAEARDAFNAGPASCLCTCATRMPAWDGTRAAGSGVLIEALARCARQAGRDLATPAEARARLGLALAGSA